MNGRELQDCLNNLLKDGDGDLIASKDDEGNGYHTINGIDVVYRIANAGDDDYVYDTLEEALEDGHDFEDLERKFLLY